MFEATFKGYMVFLGIFMLGTLYLGWSMALDKIGPGRGGHTGVVIMSIATLAIIAGIGTAIVVWRMGRRS